MTWPGLEDAALEAAASRGLLRRAERDVSAGLATIKNHTEKTAEIEVDGATVTLTPAGIRAATCTCPSREICRHILAAALLLRAQAPPQETSADPLAEINALTDAELAKAFGKPGLRDGARLLADTTAEIIVQGASCRIRLPNQPEVVFTAGAGLPGMLSKASAGKLKALHAAAILAVRGGPAERATAPRAQTRPVDPYFLSQVRAALADAARSAFRNAPRALEDRLLDLAISSRADDVPALAAVLRQAALLIAARRDHDPAFDPATLLTLLARAFAMAEALAGPASAMIRGAVRQTFTPLAEPLDLIGCGVELWRAPSGARGATAHLYAPALDRWFGATVARAPGQDPAFKPADAARRLADAWGHTLTTVAAARTTLIAAKASPAGRLSLAAETKAKLAPLTPLTTPLTPDEVATWPGPFDDWMRLATHLAAAFTPSLGAAAATSLPVMLRPAALAPAMFDDVAQRIVLPAQDAAGTWIALLADDDHSHPGRSRCIEAIAKPGLPCPTLVYATARATATQFTLHPYADLPPGAAAPRCFDLLTPPDPDRHATDRHTTERLAPSPLPPVRWPRRSGGTSRLITTIEDELLGFCELGGRMQDHDRTARLATLAATCETVGLLPLANAISRIARTEPQAARAYAVFAAVHVAASLAALRRTLQHL